MRKNGTLLAVCCMGGELAALVSSLFLWLLGDWGVTAFLNVHIAPPLSTSWLYPRLIWGGLWALPYFITLGIPRARRHWVRKGIIISLLPSLTLLFIVYPYQLGKGQAGLDLGLLTPVVVVVTHLVWGFFTGVFTRIFWGK